MIPYFGIIPFHVNSLINHPKSQSLAMISLSVALPFSQSVCMWVLLISKGLHGAKTSHLMWHPFYMCLLPILFWRPIRCLRVMGKRVFLFLNSHCLLISCKSDSFIKTEFNNCAYK